MVEILKENFESKFDEIVNSIRNATFIALDAEFTGLDVDDNCKKSLFDSPKQRYEKLRKSASAFIICQIGVAAFIKDNLSNKYRARTYNFYLSPHSHGIQDSVFSWQASCIAFLCQYKFDFNKFTYNGVPFLRLDQEAYIRNQLEKNALFSDAERDSNHNLYVKSCCSEVTKWLASNPKENETIILKVEDCVSSYIIHKEIRARFQELWTSSVADYTVEVKKVSSLERKKLELMENNLNSRLIAQVLGFSRIISTIIDEKKPLIGHNLFMDLLLIYNQFYRILPKSYEEFRSEISHLFPKIYDTKHIAYCMKKDYDKHGILQSSVLKDLYTSLDSHNGRFHVLFSPEIFHDEGFDRYLSSLLYHEAGFDAYVAGYAGSAQAETCGIINFFGKLNEMKALNHEQTTHRHFVNFFLRLAHMSALHNKSAEKHHAVPFKSLLEAMEPFVNRVNLIRASHLFLNLQGSEQSAGRPKWLVLESKAETDINLSEIVDMCSQHGSVDVKLLNRHQVLVATMNYGTAREIMKACKSKQEISVTVYDPLTHSSLLRSSLWICASLSFALGVKLFMKAVGEIQSI